jgi:hypothetical protein
MLIASISIPYSTMTCLISNQTNLSLMVEKANCINEKNAATNTCIKKDSCCLFSNGLIESNVELVFASHLSLGAYEAPKLLNLNNFNKLFIKETISACFEDERPPDIPVRILQQSFLC